MFEREAFEWTEKNISIGISMCNPSIEMYCGKAFKEGAELGYNKANEWHYVKDGDLPTKKLEEKQLLVRVRNYTEDYILAYYMLDKYYSKNGKRFYSDIDCDYPIDTEDVIAWKEIVLPKEDVKHDLMMKLKDEGIVKLLKVSILRNERLSSQEQQELCAWIECAMDFGENLDECATELEYAKTIIQDLLDNSDEYARQRAIDFLKESE